MRWVDAAITNPRPATQAAVDAAERDLRVPLPSDFLAVASVHQGAAPVPAAFDLPGGFVTAVGHLLHFEDSPFTSNIVAAQFPLEGVLDKGVIAFAHDIGGDPICFSYRADFDHPPVVYWSVDTGEVRLADSFTAFLALLHD